MKKRILILSCVFFFAFLFFGNLSKVIDLVKANHIFYSLDAKETKVKLLKLHNEERTTRGYKPLVLDNKLCEYAQKHANYMAKNNKLVHSSMSNLQKVNKDSGSVGENIAWGQETEESVVSSWMWSPMHRWNILGSSYKKVGFGLAKDSKGRNYWCVVFSN